MIPAVVAAEAAAVAAAEAEREDESTTEKGSWPNEGENLDMEEDSSVVESAASRRMHSGMDLREADDDER